MGLRYRKSIKLGKGLKVNINKNSVSLTGGTKGLHHTISSTGRNTTSVKLPGGLSYVETSGKTKKKSSKPVKQNQTNKSSGAGCGCLVILLIIAGISSIFSGGKSSDNKTTTESTTEMTTEATTEATTIETTTEVTTETTTEVTTETTTEVTTTETTTEVTTTETTTEKEITVWIAGSGNGSKYHSKSSCSNMNNPIEIPLEEAEQKGYTACKRCY